MAPKLIMLLCLLYVTSLQHGSLISWSVSVDPKDSVIMRLACSCNPTVAECFNFSPAPPPPRKTRAELMKDIDADYYGYRDEDDGLIVPLEQEMEKKGNN